MVFKNLQLLHRNRLFMKKNEKKLKRTKKSFDCIEMKNKIQAELYKVTKDLNGSDLIEFYRKDSKKWLIKKRSA